MCCVNTATGAKISEAVNSVHRWFQEADAYYAVLTDYSTCTGEASEQARRIDAMERQFLREGRWCSGG